MELMLLAVMLCAGPDDAETKATTELKALVAKLEATGTEPRVTDFVKKGKWCKRLYKAIDTEVEVNRQPDNMASPFRATVRFNVAAYLTPEYATKAEADRAELPKEPRQKTTSPGRWIAKFEYSGGRWTLNALGWRNGETRRTYPAEKDTDPLRDWWLALGGK
jgi:hypothetical protein